ncbi:hypothetical protein ASPWEDRAFT_186480 [Aspergillus wentii DTO 134E9]|uniref:Uncharacterized protein n=1 Tax=Aspergillus wentii DTO 134E9 TaxID=1073089 RepID=A0A1L9RBM5_ASPWE|nr:uncharacterized protein ASPWEDRAFT_186480 [Aspergillus wentii DTO 134E9]KAI9934851.1 hypothetical protein MW887_000471 [Aspergillus wentii]OJJ32288.1 hypothetical protein ASPWEDRAFT_186480 [Aspergillus wentii DTO 134E9]
MSDTERKSVSIRFDNIEAYQEHDATVNAIMTKDASNGEEFIMQPSYPPIYCPPPMSSDAIEKLQALEGVQVIVHDN